MFQPTKITLTQFKNDIGLNKIRQLMIIQGVMGVSMLFMAVPVFFMAVSPGGPTFINIKLVEALKILSLVHWVYAAMIYVGMPKIFRIIIIRRQTASDLNEVEQYFQLIKSAIIIRLALMESVAILGLLLMFIDNFSGNHPYESRFATNGLTVVIFLGFCLATFPTKDRIVRIFEKHFIEYSH